MSLDFMDQVLLSIYEDSHPYVPGRYPDQEVQQTAPLHVYDFVKIVRRQEAEIGKLQERVSELEHSLTHGVESNGSTT